MPGKQEGIALDTRLSIRHIRQRFTTSYYIASKKQDEAHPLESTW